MNRQKLDQQENVCQMLNVSTLDLGSTLGLFPKAANWPFRVLTARHLANCVAVYPI